MRGKHTSASDEVSGGTGATAIKLTIVAILAFGCGFITFNWSYLLKISHSHISLSHSHRTAAICSFLKCRDSQESVEAKAREARIANTTAILATRVCGSPAVDGYSHVVPKCLEDSPTAKWWNEYYASGGKQSDLVAHIELASDYDGLAVVWGIKNTKATVEECAEHCKRHMPNTVQGPFSKLPCNAFAFCPDDVCFEPDAHHHTKGDCWLKFTEGPVAPEVRMALSLPAGTVLGTSTC
ncbi:hypothetical protein V8C86DRAFT_1786622 [Haematococcus lacustris]